MPLDGKEWWILMLMLIVGGGVRGLRDLDFLDQLAKWRMENENGEFGNVWRKMFRNAMHLTFLLPPYPGTPALKVCICDGQLLFISCDLMPGPGTSVQPESS